MEKDNVISAYYADQNKQLHDSERAAGKPWGVSGRRYASQVLKIALDHKCETILDYGCGSGTMKKTLLATGYKGNVYEYDPAIKGKSDLPKGVYDIVTCTDVLEHVEPEKIDSVIEHVLSLSRVGAFFVIATVDTDQRLPDGRSAHLTVKSHDWWVDTVLKAHAFEHKLEVLSVEKKKVIIWMKKNLK